jgi:hypothetical protein
MRYLWRLFEGVVLGVVALLFFVADAHPAELKSSPSDIPRWGRLELGSDGEGDRRFREIWHRCRPHFYFFGPVVVQALIGGDLQAGLAATNAVIAAVLGGARWFPS